MNNSIWALWLTLSYEVANMYFSVGIVTALTFGVIILLRHPWWKAANAISMGLFWWSPLYWAAYRLTNRDMELACDQAVLDTLEPEGRREYARMLTELAAGRHLWGSVSAFGECDAAIRIRRAAAWRPKPEWRRGLSLILSLLLILFLFTGGWAG